MLELFAGADFLFGAGLLDSVTQMSLEELVVADEVFGMVSRLLRGVAVDREHLAVELIGQMGFKGDYLFAAHTRAHVRELWQAKLGETGTYDGWLRGRRSRARAEAAQARVDELLAAAAARLPRPTSAASSTPSSRPRSARLPGDQPDDEMLHPARRHRPAAATRGSQRLTGVRVKANRLKSAARDHPGL